MEISLATKVHTRRNNIPRQRTRKGEEIDLFADLTAIRKEGVMMSETLVDSLAVIAHSKGCTIQALVLAVMWDYVRDYNEKMRATLLEYQIERDVSRGKISGKHLLKVAAAKR